MKELLLICILLSVPLASMATDTPLNKNMTEELKTQKQGVQSQEKISQVADKTRDLLNEYRLTLRKIENTKVYNRQLKEMIQSQQNEMLSIAQQIEELKNTSREITPLMVRMVEVLDKFVSLDKPFLMEERTKRVKDLRSMLSKADVSVSEKYRKILEAYQIENEYGRTIEAYRGVHSAEGKNLTVDYFRVGRVSLMYQSLDGEESGVWNAQQKKWDELPSEFEKSLRKGINIARKQIAPDLIKVPVEKPEVL
ncbi:MAG: DUF3450 domain-containing protein [Bdellovibrionales bacterium]|nr:DUF3450 domain-containing protein [Bdellovibrionales bacterium]